MRLLISIISVIGMALLSLGYVTRRRSLARQDDARLKRLNRELHKHHKVWAVAVIAVVLLHALISVVPLPFAGINILTGGCCLLLVLAIGGAYLFRKKLGRRWLSWHRRLTALLWPMLILHVLLQLKSK